MEDADDLFAAFDDQKTAAGPPTAASASAPAGSSAALPDPAPSHANAGFPPPFAHLRHECIAGVSMHSMKDEDQYRLEHVLRECTVMVPDAAMQASLNGTKARDAASFPAGTVHYFREQLFACACMPRHANAL